MLRITEDVEFSEVPAFDVFKERLALLYPSLTPTKAGLDKTYDMFRIYVERRTKVRQPIDLAEKFLQDLRDDPRNSRQYTAELLARLDKTIESAVGENGKA